MVLFFIIQPSIDNYIQLEFDVTLYLQITCYGDLRWPLINYFYVEMNDTPAAVINPWGVCPTDELSEASLFDRTRVNTPVQMALDWNLYLGSFLVF